MQDRTFEQAFNELTQQMSEAIRQGVLSFIHERKTASEITASVPDRWNEREGVRLAILNIYLHTVLGAQRNIGVITQAQYDELEAYLHSIEQTSK